MDEACLCSPVFTFQDLTGLKWRLSDRVSFPWQCIWLKVDGAWNTIFYAPVFTTFSFPPDSWGPQQEGQQLIFEGWLDIGKVELRYVRFWLRERYGFGLGGWMVSFCINPFLSGN
jgi:hypothetical protein